MVCKSFSDIRGVRLNPFSIAWLFPHANLPADPSNRLRRFQIHNHFSKMMGFVKSEAIFYYDKQLFLKEHLMKFDVVVIFNVTDFDRDLCKFLKAENKIIIFDHCENIFALGAEDDIMVDVSAISCCSHYLAKNTEHYLSTKFNLNKPIFVIRDPIEDSVLNIDLKIKQHNIALVMGMGANVQYVLPELETACKTAGYEMLILTEIGFNFPGHRVEYWTPYTWIDHAQESSVALCCHDVSKFPAKGNVKVTSPMSIGIPVIAVPMESYKEAIIDGYNGFIVENQRSTGDHQSWVDCLNILKDPDLRSLIGLRARQTALSKYSTDNIALDYLSMIAYTQTLKVVEGGKASG
jgi:hypothetical protein